MITNEKATKAVDKVRAELEARYNQPEQLDMIDTVCSMINYEINKLIKEN